MQLDFLLLADRAEVLNGKLYMLGGGFDHIGVPQLPGVLPFDIAIGIFVDYLETSDTHTLTVTIEDADNTPHIGPITIPFATGRPPGLPPGDGIRFMAVLRGPFPITKDGSYQVVAAVNKHRFPGTPFRVIAAPTPPKPHPGE
ncbi:MAG: DUF6941 family protein [Candidatus Dormibacteria bacterium]